MNHLAIDSATEVLSVALRRDRGPSNDVLVDVRDAGLRHTRRLMSLVDSLLREADLAPAELDLVSCTRGPGSFTGLRIGMATAKGLAWAIAGARGLDAPPIVSVPTLEAMAAGIAPQPALVVLPVIDGKKRRFYGAGFLAGRRLTDDLDLEADELLDAVRRADPSAGIIVTGPHARRFAQALSAAPDGLIVDPDARGGWASTLLRLAEARLEEAGYDAVDLGPEYVRGSDAEIARATDSGR